MSNISTFEVSYCHDMTDASSEYCKTIKDVIVLAPTNNFFLNLSLDSKLCKLTGLSETDLNLIKAGVSSKFTTSNNESMNSIEYTLKFNQSDVRRYIIAILPSLSCYSRHNTYTRAHAISNFVRSSKGTSDSLLIYLFTEDVSHILGQTCSIGRCFPILNMKSKKSSLKCDNNNNNTNKLSFVILIDHLDPDESSAPSRVHLKHLINSIRLTQRLVDLPPNILTTTQYIREVEEVIKRLQDKQQSIHSANVKVHCCISGTELEKLGFGGIYNVGRASEHPPVFVCLSYVPIGLESQAPLALVGKGKIYYLFLCNILFICAYILTTNSYHINLFVM